jgi:hypothetical protein
MMAVGEGISARNASELNRQVTRQAMAALRRRGIRATVSSGVPFHPAASTVTGAAGQFPGEDVPALPAQSPRPAEVPGNHAPVRADAPDFPERMILVAYSAGHIRPSVYRL